MTQYLSFVYQGLVIHERQWIVLNALEPGWMFIDKAAFHGTTIRSLVSKGWISIRQFPDYYMMRLTKFGIEIRNGILIRHARAVDAQRKGTISVPWRRFTES